MFYTISYKCFCLNSKLTINLKKSQLIVINIRVAISSEIQILLTPESMLNT